MFASVRAGRDEFQKTNGLGNPKRPLFVRSPESLADFVNVCAALVRQVAFNKPYTRSNVTGCQSDNRRASSDWIKHLVSLLDDRALLPPKSWRSGLKPNSRHDADADVDVMRWYG